MTRLAAGAVLDAHAETLPTLPGWGPVTVVDGARLARDDSREWVTLGYVDEDAGPVLHLEPVPDAQRRTAESGTIGCRLVTAQADVPAARGRALDLLAAWTQWLVADRALAGTSGTGRLLPGSECHLSADVAVTVTRSGATADAVVTITYTATTYG